MTSNNLVGNMKYNIYIITLCIFFISCNHYRKITILGFVYPGERIILEKENNTFLIIKPYSANYDGGLRYLRQEVKFLLSDEGISFNLKIDSGGRMVLDTTINLPIQNKEPIVSIEDPRNSPFGKRSLFIIDALDSNYISY